jgi:hypothetical protein
MTPGKKALSKPSRKYFGDSEALSKPFWKSTGSKNYSPNRLKTLMKQKCVLKTVEKNQDL